MAEIWRWDQGRLDYFNFDNLRKVASVLIQLEGVNLNYSGFDPLRPLLEQETALPFAPSRYKVWRNYARIFKWTLIAARIGDQLVTTDICKKIAEPSSTAWDIDQYLSFIIPRIYYPSPATNSYNTDSIQTFPYCAILKYLSATYMQQGWAAIDLSTVFSRLVGNNCRGTEPVEFYLALPETNYRPEGEQLRQMRELLIFISQSSFLKWHNGMLHLDIMRSDAEFLQQIEVITTPFIEARQPDAEAEVIRLGAIQPNRGIPIASVARELQGDLIFTEGKRVRVTHLRVERSPQLRRLYFANSNPPFLCDMCLCDTKERYPWTDNLLELHHLLPLSSVVKMSTQGTSFNDLVPVCPNCHRSIHAYYRYWLYNHNLDDFNDIHEAHSVYQEAKSQIYLG